MKLAERILSTKKEVNEAKNPLASLDGGANNLVADVMLFHKVTDLSDVKGNKGKKQKILKDLEFAKGVLEKTIQLTNQRL